MVARNLMTLIVDEFCCQILFDVYSTQIGPMSAQVIVTKILLITHRWKQFNLPARIFQFRTEEFDITSS